MSELITIKTSFLRAIASWASIDDTRSTMQHVVFRDGEIVASNGHILCRCKYDTRGLRFGIERGVIMAACAAQDALARHWSPMAMAAGVDVEADDQGGTVIFEGGDSREIRIARDADGKNVSMEIAPNTAIHARGDFDVGKYPPIDQLMMPPTLGDPPPRGFQPKYLALVEELVSASGYGSYGVRVEAWSDKLGPVQLICPNNANADDDHIRMVLMPMKSEEEATKRKRGNAK